MNIELQEIFCCRDWAIEPIAGKQLYNALMTAIARHREGSDFEGMKKTAGFFLSKNKSFAGKLFVGDIHRIENRLYWNDEELAEDDRIINVVVIEGAVTRNGGACTYGSKDHRDQILYANSIPQVVGHLFLVNTPGGMVYAMPDYTMAFENCRELGKPTVALVDGICYSAGVWITSQCDRVLAMNPEDGIGCIGAMSGGELAPHGSINAITKERTFIIIGKASPDKNREVIEAAQGNDELLQAEADKNTERFHEVVRSNRPMVTDDLLTGKIYTAQEVMGTLVDEIGNQDRAIECIFELAEGKLKSAHEMEKVETPTNNNENDMTEEEKKATEVETVETTAQAGAGTPEKTAVDDKKPVEEEEKNEEETPNDEMKPEQEDDAPSEDEKPSDEDEEEKPEDEKEVPSDDEEEKPEEKAVKVQNNEKALFDTTAEMVKMAETLNHAEAMIEQKNYKIAELQSEIEAKAAAYTLLATTSEQQVKQISEQQAVIDKLTKQVAELKTEVKELSEKPIPMVDASAGVPTDNGTGDAPQVNEQAIKPGMDYKEIRAAYKKKSSRS